jgi:two-component system cell cycle sensor histidine kinase/response regulator CckA
METAVVTRKISVAAIVITTIISATTLMMFLLFLLMNRIIITRWYGNLHKEQTLLADELSESLALPLLNFDVGQIGRIMESAMKDDDVFGVVVKTPGKQGRTFVRMRDAAWRIMSAEREFPTTGLLVEERGIRFSREQIGTVRVIVTSKFVEAFLHKSRILTISILLPFELILALSLYLLLRRLVLKPLKEVEAYAGAVSSGSVTTGAAPAMRYRGELESLRSSTEKMINLLEARNAELQKEVKQRRESEERFRSLSNASFEGIMIHDRGVILDTNLAFARLFGYGEPDELIGQNGLEFILTPEARERIQQRMQRQESGPLEVTCVRKDGSTFEAETDSRPIKYLGHDARLVSCRDVTERKRAAEALKKSEEKFSKFFMAAPAGISVSSLSEGRILDVNQEFEKMLGYRRDEIIGRTSFELDLWLDPKDRENIVRLLRAEGKVKDLELRMRAKGGREIIERYSAETIELDGGSYLLSAFVDITEQKMAEEALRSSEEKLRLILSHSPDAIYVVGFDGKALYINAAASLLSGYSAEELMKMSFLDLVHPDDRSMLLQLRAERLAGKPARSNYPLRIVDRSGAVHWAENRVIILPWEGKQATLNYLWDVTEKRRAEEELRDSEARFRSLIEKAPVAISISREGKTIYVNQKYIHIYGFHSHDELVGRPIFDQWAPESREIVRERSKKRALGEPVPPEYEGIGQRRDGSRFPVHILVETIQLPDGPAFMAFLSDITERKNTEEKLQESERRYRTLFESAADAILLMREGRFVDCNAKTVTMFGYPQEQILGATPDRFSPPVQPDGRDSREKALEKIAAALSGQPQFFEWKHSRADGALFDAEVSLNRVELTSGMHLQAIVRDISEKKRLEDQLRQAQKMEAIGQLAGGVAHDFNNLLTVFSTYGNMLSIKLKHDEALRSYAERIVEATQKAAGLTQSLLAFGRKQTITLRPVDLSETIKKVEHFLYRIIGEDVELRTSLAGTELIVMADPGQIEQVLMNLAANARDAMPRGGLLSIQVDAVQLGDADVKAGEVERAGRYARISVADNGVGMDKTTMEKIFEPFFTTKEMGKGTGLGLAIVYGIIKQHGGTIRVYSEPGKGTVFKSYLPLTQSAAATLESNVLPVPRGGNETILLVEDNAAVRESIKIMLEDSGYHVIEAADGDDAIAEFYRHRDEIMLLLTDVIMPKKNGKEVYDIIRSMRPGITALFISGYTADIITSKGLLDEGLHLMRKPPAPDALKRKIREILDNRQGRL